MHFLKKIFTIHKLMKDAIKRGKLKNKIDNNALKK